MLYLLDANVLIDANRDYYPIERVPEFWDWLVAMGELGRVKIPQEFYEEIILPPTRPEQPDPLVDWLQKHKEALVLDEEVQENLVQDVTERGYADNLTGDEIIKIGRDPFLIAYALADSPNRCVVTHERSRPGRIRANRRLPDVSLQFNVLPKHTFDMIKELDFRTDWRGRL